MTNWDAHRRDYADFCAAHAAHAYRQHTGLPTAQSEASLRGRYSDLWRRETLAEMAQNLTDAPSFTATERASRQALLNALRPLYLAAQTS